MPESMKKPALVRAPADRDREIRLMGGTIHLGLFGLMAPGAGQNDFAGRKC